MLLYIVFFIMIIFDCSVEDDLGDMLAACEASRNSEKIE